MRLLLDSNVFLFALEGSPRLSDRARELLTDGEHDLLLSVASIWELAIKAGAGRLVLHRELGALITEQTALWRIEILQIQMKHALAVRDLPRHHRDPFDRLLIAQAQLEGLTIVSSDSLLSPYAVEVVW